MASSLRLRVIESAMWLGAVVGRVDYECKVFEG